MTPPDPPEGSSAERPHAEIDGSGREPNYLVRRAIVVGVVVVLIASIAVGVGSLIDGDESSSPSGAATSDWNAIALVDDRTGQVIVVDEAGDEQARFASGVRQPTDTAAVSATMVVTSESGAAVVDLAGETSEAIDLVPSALGVVVPNGSAVTMIVGSASGDRAVLVDGPTGDVIDTATSAPIAGAQYDVAAAIAAPGGREVLVTDAGNFQTVLFSFDRSEPSYLPGRALAVDDELVVTTQNVGTESSISVFDHDGASVSEARTASVRAAMIAGSRVILVTLDGDLLALDTGSGDVSSLDTVGVAPVQSASVATSGDRLIVVGAGGTAIVDTDGAILTELPGAVPIATGPNEFATVTSACVVTTEATDAATDTPTDTATDTGAGGVTVIALDDGRVVAEASAPDGAAPPLTSADGCTIALASVDGATVVSESATSDLAGVGEVRSLAPDGTVVIAATDDRLELHSVSDEPSNDAATGDPVDLGPAARRVVFAER